MAAVTAKQRHGLIETWIFSIAGSLQAGAPQDDPQKRC